MMSDGLVIVNHTAPVVGQFDFLCSLGWFVNATEVAIDCGSRITSIGDNMALVGILSTQLVLDQFIRYANNYS